MYKSIFLKLVVPSLCSLLLCSCATSRSNSLERRISASEEDVRDMRTLLAETRASLLTMERDIRMLKGSLESVSYRQETSQSDETVTSLEQRLERLGRRIPPPALVPLPELEADESFVMNIDDASRVRIWNNAFSRLREGNYQGALEQLSSPQLRLSSGEEYVKLLFWTGLAQEGLGRSNDAVTSYHRIGSDFGESNRAPTALLRLASIFIRLRDFESAKLTLESIKLRYPKTPEAKRADERLRDLR